MKTRAVVHLLALLTAIWAHGGRLAAQSPPSETAALRANIERRFEVLRLRDGVALRPRDSAQGVQSIEVSGGPIAVDGQPVTGAELREKLGPSDADLVLSLSYLSDDERNAMFNPNSTSPEPSAAPAPTPPGDRREFPRTARRGRPGRDGDKVSILRGDIVVAENEVVDGDVVAIGGSVRVNGEVRGDVVAVGGGITLGPAAFVSNNVVVVGGTLSRDPGARIGGRVQEIGVGSVDLGNWRWPSNPLWVRWGSMMGSAFALVGTLTRLAILCLLAAIVVLLGQTYVERTADRAATDTVKAGAFGLLAQLLFVPILLITIVLLVITIVGIPLLLLIPFLILGLAVVGLVGFTGVTYRLGGLVTARFGWRVDNPYLTTIAGIVLVMSPLLLARLIGLAGVLTTPFTFGLGLIGAIAEYLAWTVGFGAVALTRFAPRSTVTQTVAPA